MSPPQARFVGVCFGLDPDISPSPSDSDLSFSFLLAPMIISLTAEATLAEAIARHADQSTLMEGWKSCLYKLLSFLNRSACFYRNLSSKALFLFKHSFRRSA
ncbi:unnamed protein product [Aspergillus oryzae RIB40]|uniref:DNA, SC138 n=1 Tax=Aspergillus oryzae (strain ATCC 42149 / RIB 40) TaxID=510516 RepID=Q2U1R6_ASPOR|nr:unnamed protein product [Aspergillus oryzae RIB40]BAE64499.1 unnamed protein product [Aspergillus oryzae RIB40]